MRDPRHVVDELRRRAGRGQSLASGANRGDWLYAAAVKHFGSWGGAVLAAGFEYDDIKSRPLRADEVTREIQRLAAAGERLVASGHRHLAAGAVLHFGSWRAAMDAAQCQPEPLKWAPERVIEKIRKAQAAGLRVNSVAVMKRDRNLYMAGRRRFGTWAAALEAARGDAPEQAQVVAGSSRRKRRP